MTTTVTTIEPAPRRIKKVGGKGLNRSMSIQAQLELNDIPVEANEPGPGHYFAEGSPGFSSLGKQTVSKNASAPTIGFAHTNWSKWERVVISKAHGATNSCRTSQGHLYEVEAVLSKQATKIGTSLRPALEKSLGVDPHGSPGPCYNMRDNADPDERMAHPKDSMAGKSERFPDPKVGSTLGPGEYGTGGSSLKLGTGRSFGVHRKAYDKVIRPGWETEGRCLASPGIGPPMWFDPKKDGSRACPMGRAQRFPEARGQNFPGPGHYRQDERDCGATLDRGSVLGQCPKPDTIKFGTKPKKPRFRMDLAQRTAKHGGWGYF